MRNIPSEALAFSESGRAHQQRRIHRPAASRQRTCDALRDREGVLGSCLRADLREAGRNEQRELVIAEKASGHYLRQQVIQFE